MTIRTIGVPMDLGADRRGVDMGPSAIRYAGLSTTLDDIDRSTIDRGDLTVPHAEERDPERAATNAKYLPEVEAICTRLADEVDDTLADGALPLVLGGDHSIAIGTLAGAAREAEIGAVWFDAHSDINTPATTPSGNVHGMPLAAALGLGEFADTPWANAPNLSEENVVLVGLRSVDEHERERIRDSDVTAYTMSDIDERGVVDVTEEALAVATDGVDGIHVSLDMDWLDPSHAPGVGTPVRGGVTYREAHSAMELVADHDDALRSLEVVEVNPILDSHNETAELATELAASALGKRVL
ncbi:arginase [Halococcus dombrowskii]|uniref:Arginase n=1 Tax=Halococcus dombrowskii TaxID=179637 RepID=A0AAX3AND4_HALDO|nr:arginase [Halococcus dombrowskii]UOO94520.1 arginase [Halococcus dombrowskii]